MTRAVYPGTFDPLTLGHEDIARRAARLFDTVVIAVADSRSKGPLFPVEERLEMAAEVFADEPRIEVVRFSGLLVDFAREQQARVILRGVRSVTDFDYEMQLAGMNRQLDPSAETIIMTPGAMVQHVSGTLVREIAQMGGEVEKFVSVRVMARIRARVPAQAGR
jgi:pantetheine-phosphate adenylyltransferase